MSHTNDSAFYSLYEAGRYLGLNERTLRRYIALGELPAYRLGAQQIRLRKSDVEALLKPIPAGEVKDHS